MFLTISVERKKKEPQHLKQVKIEERWMRGGVKATCS